MGVVELGHFPVHTVRGHSSQSRRTHQQSEVGQFGFLDTRTSHGTCTCVTFFFSCLCITFEFISVLCRICNKWETVGREPSTKRIFPITLDVHKQILRWRRLSVQSTNTKSTSPRNGCNLRYLK